MMSNASALNFTNTSQASSHHVYPPVSVLTGVLGFSWVASVLLNGLIVVLYFKDSSLRNSFNAYVANLASAEVLLSATGMPANFIRGLYGYWPLNESACVFFQYGNYIFGSGVRYGHVLITFNRLWAVTFPVHYRKYNTMRNTYFVIAATWIYLNALHLPVIIPGRMWPKKGDIQCLVNLEFQKKAGLVQEILGFTITEVLMVVGCLLVLFKLQHRKRVGVSSVPLSGMSPKSVKTEHNSVKDGSEKHEKPHETNNGEASLGANAVPTNRGHQEKKTLSRSKNRLLVYLVISVIICWTPNHVFWLLVNATDYWNKTFVSVQFFAVYANSWINPILCFAALKPLRTSAKNLLCNCQ